MKNEINYIVVYAAAATISIIVGVLATAGHVGIAMACGFGLGLVALAHLLAKAVRIICRYQDNIFRQHECLQQLNYFLSPVEPLPNTRGYTGSPDFLVNVHRLIMQHKPRVIVEASSGVSTLVAGYSLKKLGQGQVFSLEHDPVYAKKSQDLVQQHQLTEQATAFHAPLTNYDIFGKSWRWYDLGEIKTVDKIDMIVVDGPPDRVQKNARYPVLPLLIDRLEVGGIVILDDSGRPSETEIVEQWEKAFKNIEVERLPAEKGMVVIRKVA